MKKHCQLCGATYLDGGGQPWVCSGCGHKFFDNPTTAVDVVLFSAEGEVLVTERGIEPWKGAMDMPGGFLEIGETLEECFMREAEEETGIKRDQYSKLTYVSSGPVTYPFGDEAKELIIPAFTAKLHPGVTATADDDVSAVRFVDLGDLAGLNFCNPKYPEIVRRAYSLLF